MANKGNKRRQKRKSFVGKLALNKKAHVWTFNQICGAHSNTASVPLGIFLRDVLHFVDNAREIKYLLHNKTCVVNGVRVKNHRFPVGLFDIIDFKEIDKKYRVFLTHKNKFVLKELGKDIRLVRPCKITGKKMQKKGVIQVSFDNGFVMLKPKKGVEVGDTLEYDIVKQTFGVHLPFVKNQTAYVTEGPHAGRIGEIKDIVAGDMHRKTEVVIETDKEQIRTIAKYVFVIPKDILN